MAPSDQLASSSSAGPSAGVVATGATANAGTGTAPAGSAARSQPAPPRAVGATGGGGMEGSTLFVGNLPEELNAVGQLSSHFERFGRIADIKVRPEQRHAFIQFRSRSEALAALDSSEYVLGNPRITVAWARGSASHQRANARPRAPLVGWLLPRVTTCAASRLRRAASSSLRCAPRQL